MLHVAGKDFLGTAGDDGIVNVWNVGTQTIHASFAQRHASAATALAFSPVSESHAHLHTRTHTHSHAVAAVSQPG
jgi:hypothetical protein